MIPPSSIANRRRDIPAAVGLFVATAAFVLWQNSRVAVLWDLSYLLDVSHRIALGQVPYRDFPLVHPPLTFLVQAALECLGGRHYFLTIGYAAAAGGLGTVLAWRIILRVLQIPMAWTISLLLAAPLCFVGIYSIYPHPIYDCDCALAILLAILLLQRCLADIGRGWRSAAAAGFASVLPVFFKQNIGGPFLIAVVAGLLVLLGARRWSRDAGVLPERAILVQVLCSILAGVVVGLVLIQSLWGLGNYLRWTVHFAAERRLPGLGEMFAVYRQPSFVWTLPVLSAGLLLLHTRLAARWWGKALALGLAAAPFAGSLVFLILDDDLDERADNLLALWPLLLLAGGVMAIFELGKDSWDVSLTAALGVDLCHLAAPDDSRRVSAGCAAAWFGMGEARAGSDDLYYVRGVWRAVCCGSRAAQLRADSRCSDHAGCAARSAWDEHVRALYSRLRGTGAFRGARDPVAGWHPAIAGGRAVLLRDWTHAAISSADFRPYDRSLFGGGANGRGPAARDQVGGGENAIAVE